MSTKFNFTAFVILLFYVEHSVHRFLPPSSFIFKSNYVGRIYINLPNIGAQVEQLGAVAAMDVCGVATPWT